MGVSEETVGWRVILAKYDRNSRMVEAEAEDSNSLTMGNESHFDDEVYELYENPNALDVLISQLAETRHMEEPHVKFELREKITTMRLLDNEIKMVYCQSNENDYEEMEAAEVSEDDREVFKFDDETYQAKLRTAINTNLNHKEVDNFRLVSLLFLLCLFGLCISQLYMEESSFSAIHSFLDQTNYRASQYSRLTSNIVATLNTTADYPALVADNQRHEVVFET